MNTRRYSILIKSLLVSVIAVSLFINPTKDAVEAGDVDLASVTVSLAAVMDVTLAADYPDHNFQNMGPFLEVDYWHYGGGALSEVRIFLVQFDLTGLPPDAIIDNALLQLDWNACEKSGTYPVTLGAYFVNSFWTESTVTYNTRPSWGTMGYNSQVGCPPDGLTIWNVTSFAQAWQIDPLQNYGVKVSGSWNAGDNYSIAFNSREYPNVGKPELVVTYHQPPTRTPTPTITRTPTRTSTPTRTPTSTSTPSGMNHMIYLPLMRR